MGKTRDKLCALPNFFPSTTGNFFLRKDLCFNNANEKSSSCINSEESPTVAKTSIITLIPMVRS